MTDMTTTGRTRPLELVPLESEAPPPTGRAKFSPNTRSGTERRSTGERRRQQRLEAPRRSTEDRRPKNGWDKAQP